MLAVHSGQRSTSAVTEHTSGGGAGISTVMLNWIEVMARISFLLLGITGPPECSLGSDLDIHIRHSVEASARD